MEFAVVLTVGICLFNLYRNGVGLIIIGPACRRILLILCHLEFIGTRLGKGKFTKLGILRITGIKVFCHACLESLFFILDGNPVNAFRFNRCQSKAEVSICLPAGHFLGYLQRGICVAANGICAVIILILDGRIISCHFANVEIAIVLRLLSAGLIIRINIRYFNCNSPGCRIKCPSGIFYRLIFLNRKGISTRLGKGQRIKAQGLRLACRNSSLRGFCCLMILIQSCNVGNRTSRCINRCQCEGIVCSRRCTGNFLRYLQCIVCILAY